MGKINLLAFFILSVMFLLMLVSVWNDSAIIDELAHIPAGYGYVTQLDYRLNPEHPPLIKALSAASAWIFARPHFPTDTPYWRDDINGQWAQGAAFLYESGNDADSIIFWSRFPLLLLTLFFGWALFDWVKKRFNSTAAILALSFFAFSPTILAHARYVTTDMAAALGFFLGITSFIAFLEYPNKSNIFRAGFFLGVALLLKFSTVLLIPFYGILLVVWIWSQEHFFLRQHIRVTIHLVAKTIIIGVIALLTVSMVYGLFTLNYPQARQLRDAEFLLGSYGFRPAAHFNLALIQNPFTAPLGEYMLGALMVQQRAAGGNTTYFLGDVSAAGSRLYFPILYILKEPLPIHILSLTALWFSWKKIRARRRYQGDTEIGAIKSIRRWINQHFVECASILFIIFYWAVSIRSPLNIGIRHILPTLPFIYLLTARTTTEWLHMHATAHPQTMRDWLVAIFRIFLNSIPRYAMVVMLMLWLTVGTIFSAPAFLSYYNGLIGTQNGWTVAVDSNYDWGQDLKRLANYADRHDIQKIAVDYFGGGSPRYDLGDRFEPWWSAKGPVQGWFAISASTRQGAFGTPVNGFIRRPEDAYAWLRPYLPVARIGTSIFLYKLP